MKLTTIEHLKKLESLVWYEIPGEGPRSGYSPCDDIRFMEALKDAWPKLLAVISAAKRQVDEFPEDCQEDLIYAVWEFE